MEAITILAVISVIFSVVAIVMAIESNKRFLGGDFKNFVEWVTLGIGYFFISGFVDILLDFLGVAQLNTMLRAISFIAAIVASCCFIKAALQLNKLSKLYGFAEERK